jgi:glutathione peroxidase
MVHMFKGDPKMGLNDFCWLTAESAVMGGPDLKGRVVLVVNTASACGFTPQFAGLEDLWQRFRAQGLVVLGFPCNQFRDQDPGSTADSVSLCQARFGVSFPMMAKIEVNGPHAEPLFQWLKTQAPGVWGSESIKWNFTKFLIGRDGRVIARFAPMTLPGRLVQAIEAALGTDNPGPA